MRYIPSTYFSISFIVYKALPGPREKREICKAQLEKTSLYEGAQLKARASKDCAYRQISRHDTATFILLAAAG